MRPYGRRRLRPQLVRRAALRAGRDGPGRRPGTHRLKQHKTAPGWGGPGMIGTARPGGSEESRLTRSARSRARSNATGTSGQSGGPYTESERLRPARAGVRCRGSQVAGRDVDGTQLAIAQKAEGPGRATHTSPARSGAGKVTTPLRGQGPDRRQGRKVRRRSGGPARSSGHPELGRSQGRHPVAVRGTVGVAGPGPPHKVTRTTTGQSGSRATAGRGGGRLHKPPSGRGPGGVGSNPGSSVYSRGGSGRDPGRQPTQGPVGPRLGLPSRAGWASSHPVKWGAG